MKQIFLWAVILIFAQNGAYALTLKESTDLALKNNPQMLSAQKKLAASRARLSQAAGALLPTLKLDAAYGRSYSDPSVMQITVSTASASSSQIFSVGTNAVDTTKSYTVSLSQPIFAAGLFPAYQIAQKSVDFAKEELKKSASEITFSATLAYFNVLTAEKLYALALESKKMTESHYKKAKSMLNAGSATRADLLRAEVQMVNAITALTVAENSVHIARNNFNNVLGKNLNEAVALENFPSTIPPLPNLKHLQNHALLNRPEIKQFNLNKKIAEQNAALAKTGYLPMIYLSGQTGNRIIEDPSYQSDVNSWSISGTASWILFDGFQTANRIREAEANLDAQKFTEEQIKTSILLEVCGAYLNLKSTIETLESRKKAVESARENYRVCEKIFESGAATNLEVIDAHNLFIQAKMNYIQSIYELELAKAKINKTGGL